jgi:hypothetical protein
MMDSVAGAGVGAGVGTGVGAGVAAVHLDDPAAEKVPSEHRMHDVAPMAE